MNKRLASNSRRLQRDRDFTGDRLTRFSQVFFRHGLPGLILALMCLSLPHLQPVFANGIKTGVETPGKYILFGLLVVAGLSVYGWSIDRQWSIRKLGWVVYLGGLSFWEEWVFRLALPHLLEQTGTPVMAAAAMSAVLFGGAHYFTLRWKWQWCVGAAFGSLILSRQMELHNDLFLITAFHWIATYLNTPRPPGELARQISISTRE